MGHIVRCSALAEFLAEAGIEPYLYINSKDEVVSSLRGFSYKREDWLKGRHRLFERITTFDIVIVDSYLADLDFYKELSERIKLSIYIDDTRRLSYPKGVVVNFAIYARKLYQDKKGMNNYILGTEYVPLRKAFTTLQQEDIVREDKVRQILICFGGSDPGNLSLKVLRILKNNRYSGIKKILLSRKFSPAIERLNNLATDDIEILYDPDPDVIVKTMTSSDMAVSSAGMILYELACCRVPVIAISVADNQKDGLREFVNRGFTIQFLDKDQPDLLFRLENLIDFYIANFPEVSQNAQIGRDIVDGYGGQRLTQRIVEIFKSL